ncbi:MAG: S-layer homology domain-containing protein, partial [Firmicutes bacterium]|nr:S-layer homology domain-containing protein [Bacillota bacterium]
MCRKAHSFATVMLSLVMTFAVIAAPLYLPGAAEQSTASAAVNLKDIANHWARTYIQKAVDKGIVNGYDDNTFRPDKNVTRAEFVKMINGTLGNTGTVLPDFSDVTSDMWFYTDVSKGVAACYVSGYGDGAFGPDNTITRQEAAVLLSRIVPTAGAKASLNSYVDAGEIAPWARTAMEKIVGKKYMTGDRNMMTPTACLTRGMAAKLVIELSEGEEIRTNNQTINRDDVTIENVIYANQLSVGTQVGSGTATVKNSTILGNLNVIGGGGEGEKGVYIQDARIAKMTVNRTDETVQIFTEGESTVVNTYIRESASLIESNSSGINGDFGKGFVNVYMGRKTDLNLNGDLELLEMQDVKCDAIADSNCTIDH